jgi:hypothetical protein
VTDTLIEPVVVTVVVAATKRRAWSTFTEQVGRWWPAGVHSVGGEPVVDVVMEPRVGGRFYERWDDGTECEWGGVTRWEPPDRVEVWWRPNPDATYEPTTVVVTFVEVAEGTEVTLVHRGWERLGAEGADTRDGYSQGWPVVLAPFVELLAT